MGFNSGFKGLRNGSLYCMESSLFLSSLLQTGGPRSVVGIATGYGLDGPGIGYGGSEIFRTCPARPWGPHSLLHNGYRVFPEGKQRPGRDADPLPPSSAVGRERVPLLSLWAVRSVQSLSACTKARLLQ